MNKLAIIIPAYKAAFFDSALQSLANQTCKDFKVYIGDDCSPDLLKPIADKFSANLDLYYHRFTENMGKSNLVKHWERCVNLSSDEDWILLFSDDDILENECIAKFYENLYRTNKYYDVYRFNTIIIDHNNKLIYNWKESPDVENPMSLAYHILMKERGNSMPDHIFRNSAFKAKKGFVNFPFAQATDWATSIKFAYPKGIFTIPGPKVKWRYSGQNLSSTTNQYKSKMISGHLGFIKWINELFTVADEKEYGITLEQIKIASESNMWKILKTHYQGVPYKDILSLAFFVKLVFKKSLINTISKCVYLNMKMHNLKVSTFLNRLIKQ